VLLPCWRCVYRHLQQPSRLLLSSYMTHSMHGPWQPAGCGSAAPIWPCLLPQPQTKAPLTIQHKGQLCHGIACSHHNMNPEQPKHQCNPMNLHEVHTLQKPSHLRLVPPPLVQAHAWWCSGTIISLLQQYRRAQCLPWPPSSGHWACGGCGIPIPLATVLVQVGYSKCKQYT
jgi:hypothetical protein